ncbi:MAG: RnfABCDGE type electron transport complex subunit B [Gammaproteobacteria bacterium]
MHLSGQQNAFDFFGNNLGDLCALHGELKMQVRIEAIDALLPQHQCKRCGYDGCRPYAEALATGQAAINRCPPGGTPTVKALAELLHTEPLPLDPEVGDIEPATVARIDETVCIGCTKCLPACPVDAIVGAPKLLHEVIEGACTGCSLCILPCPVDCISLETIETEDEAKRRLDPPQAGAAAARERLALRASELRERYARHLARQKRDRRRRRRDLDTGDADDLAARKQEIAAAVARVHARRTERT